MKTVTLNPNQEERVLSGVSSIIVDQISHISDDCQPGDVVDIRSYQKKFLGRGYVNPEANIRVRVLTRHDEPINKNFFLRRVKRAVEFRKKMISDNTNAFRLIFSDSDFLPGLIVDVYGKCLVIQIITLGMEKHRKTILEVLRELLQPQGIYARNDTQARLREGLALEKKMVYGRCAVRQEVRENGVLFLADIENGHKTGLYLDRRVIRNSLRNLVQGKRVLDCFCYNGAFSLYAQKYAAEHTLGIDISGHALKQASRNMQLNRIPLRRYRFKEADVFEELKQLSNRRETFDVVIIDPPNFISSLSKKEAGTRMISRINTLAMRVLKKSGVLVNSNSSCHVDEETFKGLIREAGQREARVLRQIDWGIQSPDHPVLMRRKETLYLKCLFAEVI